MGIVSAWNITYASPLLLIGAVIVFVAQGGWNSLASIFTNTKDMKVSPASAALPASASHLSPALEPHVEKWVAGLADPADQAERPTPYWISYAAEYEIEWEREFPDGFTSEIWAAKKTEERERIAREKKEAKKEKKGRRKANKRARKAEMSATSSGLGRTSCRE